MLRKTGLFATLAVIGLAAPASATEHYVLMMGEGYFPDTTYAQPGDTIRFINSTAIPSSATAKDASWSTGVLNEGEQYVLPLVEGMKMTFESVEGAVTVGQIIFGEAPLSDNEG